MYENVRAFSNEPNELCSCWIFSLNVPKLKFDGNLTDPETGADQFVRVDVEIPADANYPPGTQLMNLHDYKMIMPIASGLVSMELG